ncbi:response regulator [Rhizobium mesoamericanum]|uniref:Response regulator receiver protein n=1 Tax=Rhizobium mesoamericanum STM3625 TaxID=1211777 RepID=K0PWQ8_9HYPH|nr:response regulator [Rhizobium mesoamericanum]CCM78173.1 Response regulator receiver protein [Rhizobium mesoamericanum STM3625]
MSDRRSEWISKRAYALWEEAGRPVGHDEEHWMKAVAERELMERTQASCDGQEVLARKRALALVNTVAPARVLLVDEVVAQRHHTMVALARAGISAAEAGNADQALVLLKKNRFDAVITDMSMPGHVNGLGLASCVRSLWPRTKVIIVSGLAKVRKVDLGPGVSFLARPVPDARLIAAVHGSIRHR